MKPIMLASPSIKIPPIDEALKLAKGNDLGEIDSCRIDDSWDVVPFFEHLRNCGYRPRDCEDFLSLSLTFVNGACRWHTDPGFGIVACWLVHSENALCSDAQLITRHGALDMREGDLCLFNANRGHAWLSNAPCVMVMATVARIRSHQAS